MCTFIQKSDENAYHADSCNKNANKVRNNYWNNNIRNPENVKYELYDRSVKQHIKNVADCILVVSL